MRSILIGLLLSLIFATYNCNRSSAKPKREYMPIEIYEQLNEMEAEIIREGELFNSSKFAPVREETAEEKLIYENFSDFE